MRFMLFMHPGLEEGADWMPSAEDVATMERYNEELRRAGVLLELSGLHPTSEGALVRFATGKPVVEDGPFGEAKEVVGGYWLIQAASTREAVEWATRVPASGDAYIEVRRVHEMDEFPPELQAAAGHDPSKES
ncbi:MAG: YciI family protein [Candidatus Dormibacteraceae bacterium]